MMILEQEGVLPKGAVAARGGPRGGRGGRGMMRGMGGRGGGGMMGMSRGMFCCITCYPVLNCSSCW